MEFPEVVINSRLASLKHLKTIFHGIALSDTLNGSYRSNIRSCMNFRNFWLDLLFFQGSWTVSLDYGVKSQCSKFNICSFFLIKKNQKIKKD